jgi:hypothetical protein
MKEITLPSGAVLKINVAPFADAKALYQAVLEEFKSVHVDSKTDMSSVFKDFACSGFSSKKVEACLWECFKRCQYNRGNGDLKIDKDTFEPVEAREDYVTVCMAVAKENILPFMKSLYAEFHPLLAMIENTPA